MVIGGSGIRKWKSGTKAENLKLSFCHKAKFHANACMLANFINGFLIKQVCKLETTAKLIWVVPVPGLEN